MVMLLSLGMDARAFEVNTDGTCQIEGVVYPAIGYGTYPQHGEICYQCVAHAAELGYRIIDTATYYRNFVPISEAVKPYGRQSFYIISKVWHDAQQPEQLHEDINMTLKQLHTTYIDAYLLHWPNSKVSIEDTLRTMDELRTKGLIRHIGLSNVNVNHVKRALETNIPISWVQVEMHPNFYDAELLEFCQNNKITVQAWAPLGRGRLCEDPNLAKLGEKYGKTASQIALRWILQHGCISLPGSKNQAHMKENLDILNFALTREEMDEIDARAKVGARERLNKGGLGFTDEFDFTYEECWPKSPLKPLDRDGLVEVPLAQE